MDDMTEKIDIPDANLTVDDRLNEVNGRLLVQTGIMSDIERQALDLPEDNKNVVNKMKKSSAETAVALTDSDWVFALRKANVPEEEILRIWKIKDEDAGKERDLKNQRSAA